MSERRATKALENHGPDTAVSTKYLGVRGAKTVEKETAIQKYRENYTRISYLLLWIAHQQILQPPIYSLSKPAITASTWPKSCHADRQN